MAIANWLVLVRRGDRFTAHFTSLRACAAAHPFAQGPAHRRQHRKAAGAAGQAVRYQKLPAALLWPGAGHLTAGRRDLREAAGMLHRARRAMISPVERSTQRLATGRK
jgi:hypothetical protein